MAEQVPLTSEQIKEKGVGGNAEGVMREQQHKPGMTEKLKHTFANVKDRVTGSAGSPKSPAGQQTYASSDAVPQQHSPIAKDEGSPRVPEGGGKPDFGERLICMLPGSHENPYSIGHQYAEPQPSSPAADHERHQSPRFLGKLKNLVTGQKPAQGIATENATTATAGTTGAKGDNFQQGYTLSPTPEKSADFYGRTKGKLGTGGKQTPPDAGSQETWPSPAKPDIHKQPGAVFTDEKGHPIEGPTLPKEEDTKKEGVMTKIMDKLNIGEDREPTATARMTDTEERTPLIRDMGTEHTPATEGTGTEVPPSAETTNTSHAAI